jgi:hypothetical protein
VSDIPAEVVMQAGGVHVYRRHRILQGREKGSRDVDGKSHWLQNAAVNLRGQELESRTAEVVYISQHLCTLDIALTARRDNKADFLVVKESQLEFIDGQGNMATYQEDLIMARV